MSCFSFAVSPSSLNSSQLSTNSPIYEPMNNSIIYNEVSSNASSGNSSASSSTNLSTDHTAEQTASPQLSDHSIEEADSPQLLHSTSEEIELSLQASLDEGNIAAEIAAINQFVANIESNLAEIGLQFGTVSTPRVVSARRNRHLEMSDQPVDLIDLSDVEFVPRTNAAARLNNPEDVIDLCTPPRNLPSFVNLTDSNELPMQRNFRRRLNDVLDNAQAEVLETQTPCKPSPPKRTCSADNSQTENAYKCPVCFESALKREPSVTRCGHVFCKDCIEAAVRLSRKCPLCNKKMTMKQISRIYL